jgi:hypothetical protein
VLFENENGQFTPPWPTRPVALHVMVDPDSVPLPDPDTLMLLAQVAVNVTLALLVPVGVTVYFKFPQPLAEMVGVADCQVPANASMGTLGPDGVVGDVGVVDVEDELVLLDDRKSHPAASPHASTMAATVRVAFMIPLSVRVAQIRRLDMMQSSMALDGVYSVLPTAFSDSGDNQERVRVLETVITSTVGRAPVVARTTAEGARVRIAYSWQAKQLRAAGAVVTRPVWPN